MLCFSRLDYPAVDPEEWRKLLSIKLVDGKTSVSELPLDYFLRPPFAPTFEENYAFHGDL